ncbi:MAG: YggS family pyridoxal phosphate-dependent enzyme [Legionellaceae bacterium]|nr:YggS family pyridoxal phosphate-dependent enzyme [Legionellaceae bacterium]
MPASIAQRLPVLQQKIQHAAISNPDTILFLAVSKGQPISAIQEAYALGLRHFGENYVQEALKKQAALPSDINWHFIGQLQKNKIPTISAHFQWVQGVSSVTQAQALSQHRSPSLPALQICIQVNLDAETQKNGCTPETLPELISAIQALPHLQLQGLMALPKLQLTAEKQYASFSRFRILRDSSAPSCNMLSMGTSDDFEAAIRAGSNCVRIGTALFGPRIRSDIP